MPTPLTLGLITDSAGLPLFFLPFFFFFFCHRLRFFVFPSFHCSLFVYCIDFFCVDLVVSIPSLFCSLASKHWQLGGELLDSDSLSVLSKRWFACFDLFDAMTLNVLHVCMDVLLLLLFVVVVMNVMHVLACVHVCVCAFLCVCLCVQALVWRCLFCLNSITEAFGLVICKTHMNLSFNIDGSNWIIPNLLLVRCHFYNCIFCLFLTLIFVWSI